MASNHLTTPGIEDRELEERMNMYVPGQVTWPELHQLKTCAKCGWFSTDGVRQKEGLPPYGRCAAFRNLGIPSGKAFIGRAATACRYFK